LRLGIDLGGTHVKMALVDQDGRIVDLKQVDTPTRPRELVALLRRTAAPWFGRRLLGTGVGVAGDVDPVRGVVRFAPNLRWKNVPLGRLFRRAGFPGPIFFDNDASAAAWGAYHVEIRRRSRDLVVLTLGTGVGGGLVLDGRIYRGVTGSAGELGHMAIDPRGPLCGCGARGCLETFVGGVHLVRRARKLFPRWDARRRGPLTPAVLHALARRGDRTARRLWDEAGTALGTALSNLINIFNPDTILLCGGVAGASSLLLGAARREIARSRFRTPRRAVRLRVSVNGKHLGVVGSALLVP
jgi:glucokinase